MTLSAFEIKIVKQGWLETPAHEYNAEKIDLCTHGDVRLIIGGEVVAPGDGQGEYGIGEAALALLRTIESDHTAGAPWGSDKRVAQRLIPHGCGAILMFTCPIGIEWSVTHERGRVLITDVRRYDSVDEEAWVDFPGLAVEITDNDYRHQVVAFAQEAKEPFEGVEKTISDDFDRQTYEEFWQEYNWRLASAES
jgi:hypothetical protein